MFVGREREIELLESLFKKKTASLVLCRGRRRIGKSTLIQQFATSSKTFLEFQGLPPREGLKNTDQRGAFSEQLAAQTDIPALRLENWPDAFSLLAGVIRDEKTVILLDEISWLAGTDRDFAGHLKIAWDTRFKKLSRLVLVVCGSVSSWIDRNILNNTGFVGRVSLEMNLRELPLVHCNKFWGLKAGRVSSFEKLKLLSVTGGVPRYLEEIDPGLPAEDNIKRMCFSREGLLFSEFDRIFNDVFSRRAEIYTRIVGVLAEGRRSVSQICDELGVEKSGNISRYLQDLVASGFIAQDYSYSPGSSRRSRFTYFRLKDNYLRFYLKYIAPMKERVLQGLTEPLNLESFVEWDVITGYQFENLVLNNITSIFDKLSIAANTVVSASPYFQTRTKRRKACQIDLLIQTKHTLYVCEIQFRKTIAGTVISDVQDKIRTLKRPADMTVRPVLIYAGRLVAGVREEGYFDACIGFEDILSGTWNSHRNPTTAGG